MVSQLRMRGSPQGHGDPSAGELALPVSSHRAGADGPPQPVHRVWARVAPRHEQGRRAPGEAVTTGCAVGAGRHCVPAPERRPRRRALTVSWNNVNDAILAEVTQVLIEDPDRFDGVRLIGRRARGGATRRGCVGHCPESAESIPYASSPGLRSRPFRLGPTCTCDLLTDRPLSLNSRKALVTFGGSR